MKQKGMVMKVQNGFCFVLTQDKQFLKLPLPPDTEVGQEIEWIAPEIAQPEKTPRLFRRKRWIPVVGIVASVLLVIGVWRVVLLNQSPQVYAYVSVDINPSVEFTIDQKGQVFEQDGWNDDGTTILSKLSTLHKPIQVAVQSLFQAAKQEGYLDKNKEVLITAIPATDSTDQAQETELQSITSLENSLVSEVQHSLTGTSVQVKGLTVSKQVRVLAQKLRISPGKLAFFLQARSRGIPLSIEQVKQESIAKLISEHKELAGVYDRLNAKQIDSLLEKWSSKPHIQSGHKKQNQDEKSNFNQDKYLKNGKINKNMQQPQTEQQKLQGEGQQKQSYKQNPPVRVDLGRSTKIHKNTNFGTVNNRRLDINGRNSKEQPIKDSILKALQREDRKESGKN